MCLPQISNLGRFGELGLRCATDFGLFGFTASYEPSALNLVFSYAPSALLEAGWR